MKQIKKDEEILTKDDLEKTISSIFDNTVNSFDTGNEDKLKDLDTVKIIIKELLAVDKHLPSTTKLNSIQVTELAQASYLNKIFKSKLIDEYMITFMKLKRSETKEIGNNLLEGLLSIGNNSSKMDNFSDVKSILGNRIK